MDDAVGWAVAAGFCYFTYRYLFGASSGARAPRVVHQTSIDAVTSMFPQITQNQARFELHNNGGSVERAVERALREGTLPEPPAGFFPEPTAPPPSAPAATAARPATTGSSSAASATPSSLIKRLQLEGRLDELPPSAAAKGKGRATDEVPSTPKGKGRPAGATWEASPELREKSLNERKAKMVLEARRKLQEKEAARKEAEMSNNHMYA